MSTANTLTAAQQNQIDRTNKNDLTKRARQIDVFICVVCIDSVYT